MHHPQQTATPATTAKPTAAQLKEQLKSIIDAQTAAREASQAAREAGRSGAITLTPPPYTVRPGAFYTVQPGPFGPEAIPRQAVDISIAFFVMCAVMVIGWPIARALGRRLERRADGPTVSPGMSDQLQRIEQAMDAMSIEIERISESQRFMAKLQNAQKSELKGLSG